jgi:hypothetical protein
LRAFDRMRAGVRSAVVSPHRVARGVRGCGVVPLLLRARCVVDRRPTVTDPPRRRPRRTRPAPRRGWRSEAARRPLPVRSGGGSCPSASCAQALASFVRALRAPAIVTAEETAASAARECRALSAGRARRSQGLRSSSSQTTVRRAIGHRHVGRVSAPSGVIQQRRHAGDRSVPDASFRPAGIRIRTCASPRIRASGSTSRTLAFVIWAAWAGRSESTDRARPKTARRRSGEDSVSGAQLASRGMKLLLGGSVRF